MLENWIHELYLALMLHHVPLSLWEGVVLLYVIKKLGRSEFT
jgi:hypothetical protein